MPKISNAATGAAAAEAGRGNAQGANTRYQTRDMQWTSSRPLRFNQMRQKHSLPLGRKKIPLSILRPTALTLHARPTGVHFMASLGLPRGRNNLALEICRQIAATDRGRWGTAPPFIYSRASASTGSSRAADRAGMKPNTTPIRLADAIASTIDSAE